MAKKRRCTQKTLRDEALYEYYSEVVRSYGENAPLIKKRIFYEKVAERFYVNCETVQRIISAKLTNKTRCPEI